MNYTVKFYTRASCNAGLEALNEGNRTWRTFKFVVCVAKVVSHVSEFAGEKTT